MPAKHLMVRYKVKADRAAENQSEPENVFARAQAVGADVSRFLELAPAQRSCVILKDVLDHSLDEIAALLELSVPAIKAALHRGRAKLRELSEAARPAASSPSPSPALVRYAALFNVHDWDGVRAMLVDDVKLDLVSRWKRAGRDEVSGYFTNYDKIGDWHLHPAWLDGREVLAGLRNAHDVRPGYFIELTLVDGRVCAIRDFRYVPYSSFAPEVRSSDKAERPTGLPRPPSACSTQDPIARR